LSLFAAITTEIFVPFYGKIQPRRKNLDKIARFCYDYLETAAQKIHVSAENEEQRYESRIR